LKSLGFGSCNNGRRCSGARNYCRLGIHAAGDAVRSVLFPTKGEKIPISNENAGRIAEVVTLLRRESEQSSRRVEHLKSLSGVRGRLDGCLAELAGMSDNADAAELIEYGLEKLGRLSLWLRRQS
jgi:hypothetical protein